MVLIRRYNSSDRADWNSFVEKSKNSTFLFNRAYVDYHQDRFKDHSLLVYSDNKLSGLFIANEKDDRIESHGGLTYGGLILDPTSKLEQVLQYFCHITKYYHSNGFKSILYKSVPSYFAAMPSNEDLYALFLLNASLVKREASMVIDLAWPFKEKSQKSFNAVQSKDPEQFWNEVLIPNLNERYSAEPVHSLSEMKLLMERFPKNIELFEVRGPQLTAGAVVYVTPTVAHLQYISSNQLGRTSDASSALIDYLVKEIYAAKKYFSLGTSNTNAGRSLNKGLLNWKEGFGARTHVHDFYEIQTSNSVLLEDYE